MTPAIKAAIQIVIKDGFLDPAELHWFDMTGMVGHDSISVSHWVANHRPPFKKCMVVWVWNGYSFMMTVAGSDPEKGIGVYLQCEDRPPIAIVYEIEDGDFAYRPFEESDTIDEMQLKLVLLSLGSWYKSLDQGRLPAHQPYARPTILNQRKIAKGKPPKYEWKTVYLEPIKPRSEPKGGTHASPRLHDRRGHLRRLRNGRSVWVKPCKVGDASKGAVWHDYAIRSKSYDTTRSSTAGA